VQVIVKYPQQNEIIQYIKEKWHQIEAWSKDKELRVQIDRDGEIGVDRDVRTQHREISRPHS
jgi:hypothetical protein